MRASAFGVDVGKSLSHMILLGVGNRDRYQISTLAADLAHHAAGSYAMLMAAWFMEQRCLEHRKHLFFAAFPKRTANIVLGVAE